MHTSALANAELLFERLEAATADAPGVTRASFGEGEAIAHNIIIEHAVKTGLEHRYDSIGNLYITLPGVDRSAPALMTGSHLDSVPHGGNFDGAAGVIAGIALLEVLSKEQTPPFDITVMAIRAEEMIWFPEHYLGSRAAFGLLPTDTPERIKRSDTGLTLAEHMQQMGFSPDTISTGTPTLNAKNIRLFIELHIEQGPVLVEKNIPVGIVTAIRGNIRYRFCAIDGKTTHAGGVPRRSRQDAVLAGAELLQCLEKEWLRRESHGEDLVLTIGQFCTDAEQHGITKVPGRIDFTLDFRSTSSETLSTFNGFLIEHASVIAQQRNVTISLNRATQAAEALMDTNLIAKLEAAASRCDIPAMQLASGGGHDCAVFCEQGIPSAMLFIRNENGSHNPDEAMDFADFTDAFHVFLNFTRDYINLKS